MNGLNFLRGRLRFVWATALSLSWLLTARSGWSEPAIQLERQADRVVIRAGKQPVATYVFRDPKIARPYFAHLHAPGGLQVSRNHPPIAGRDLDDHATYHPGLWLAFGDVSGQDNWRLKAAVEHQRFDKPPTARGARGEFTVLNHYLGNDRKTVVCAETCRVVVNAVHRSGQATGPPVGFLIAWDSRFTPVGGRSFYFGDQEEMGLGIRVATPLAVRRGGRMLDGRGRRNEKQIWGKSAAWCDYAGKLNGSWTGITLMNHPGNFRPSWFHARDYGLLVANPFGRRALTRGERSRVEVAADGTLRLRFGVLLHRSKQEDDLDRAALFRRYVELAGD